MKFLLLIFLPCTIYSQTVNMNWHYQPKAKKVLLLSVKKNHIFKFTASSNVNPKAINTAFRTDNFDQLQSMIKYEIRTKFYVSKRINILLKTQVSGMSQLASVGLIYKIRHK